jgi:hypothetical protein
VLTPFHNRPELGALYEPLVGKTMLELGGKQDGGRVYKPYFESRGFTHTSVDWNGEFGALVMDLRKPLNLGTFDMVTNIGTSEHVSEDNWDGQVACWRNIVEAMHMGSVLICDTPEPGGWRGHGTWYPQPQFYLELASLNGMTVERTGVCPWRPGHQSRKVVFARMTRVAEVAFAMPSRERMWRCA